MIKKINNIFAIVVLGVVGWVLYQLIFNDASVINSIALILVYSFLALYFLKHGYMPYQAKEVEEELHQYEKE